MPFADHNAMLDPTCPDITGPRARSAVRAAASIADIRPCGAAWSTCCGRRSRTEAGTGAGASTYIYGTFLALRGLRAAGERRPRGARPARRRMAALHSERRRRLGRKLRQLRQRQLRRRAEHAVADRLGGAGAAGRRRHHQPSVHHGIEYLLETQRADGGWDERLATGTGFPRVFYLTYHLYRHSFPLLALVGSIVKTSSRHGATRIAHEISAFDDRRHGRIHRQEQDAAASGVAEER